MSIDAVKITTTIAQPFVVAGTPFTLTTTVTNAHPEPIEVASYIYHIPYQVQWIHDIQFSEAFQAFRSRRPLLRNFLPTPWRKAAQPPGTPMTYGNTADPNNTIDTVLPGESTSYSFKAIVPGWLFAASAELTFQGRVSYRTGGASHMSPFQVTFPLRAPLRSNVIGAIGGSVLGSLAQTLRDKGGVPLSAALLSATGLAMILAVIAVVFSSRRTKDVQPILTVEDFWGGVVVGFLLGYLGHQFFQTLVPVAKG